MQRMCSDELISLLMEQLNASTYPSLMAVLIGDTDPNTPDAKRLFITSTLVNSNVAQHLKGRDK